MSTYDLDVVFNNTPTTEIYTSGHTLALHDALPISDDSAAQGDRRVQVLDRRPGRLTGPGWAGPGRPPWRAAGAKPEECRSGALGGAASSLRAARRRSEEHTSELQSLMRISYAVFCLQKKILL